MGRISGGTDLSAGLPARARHGGGARRTLVALSSVVVLAGAIALPRWLHTGGTERAAAGDGRATVPTDGAGPQANGAPGASRPTGTAPALDLGPQATWVPAGAFTGLPAPLPAPASRTVALFGDSLVLQSFPYAERIAAYRGYRLVGAAFGGLALCDETKAITTTFATDKPSLIVLAFVGNAITPCMRPDGRAPTPEATVGAYIRDARAVVAQALAHGAQVWLVAPPRMRAPDRDALAAAIERAWRTLAAFTPGVRVVASAAFVSPTGYAAQVPCLAFETTALGCRNGAITVRSPDGTHLAPPRRSPPYSPGAWRYAQALVGALAPR